MLVNHQPGSVLTTAGDLDNRIKGIVDALKVPDKNSFNDGLKPARKQCPVLMEDDSMVTELRVRSEWWTGGASLPENHADIRIEVYISTSNPNYYSEYFSGD